MEKNGDGWVPLLNGDGIALVDRHRQLVYESPSRYLLCDLHGYAVYDENGDLCFGQVDDDELASQTWLVYRQAPIAAAEMDSVLSKISSCS